MAHGSSSEGNNLLTVRSQTYISCGQYLCSDR